MTRHSLLTGALLAAALSLAARSAIAQDYRPDRPYNGVFAPRRSNGGHQFEIDWAAMTAHDDNLTAEPELVSDPRGGFGGGWGSAEASVRYTYEGQPTHLRATASGRDRYYPSLSNLSGVDYPKRNVIEVVYNLYSYPHRHLFTLKVEAPRDNPVVPTVSGVWSHADWQEREAFDLLGVVFDGHPDLRRILMPEDWPGHPLRKDFVEPEEYHGISTSRESLLKA